MNIAELKAAYTAARDADETYRAALRMAINEFNARLDKAAEVMRGDIAYALKKRAGEALIRDEIAAQIDFAGRYADAAIGTESAHSARNASRKALRNLRRGKSKAILTQALAARAEARDAARNKRKEPA